MDFVTILLAATIPGFIIAAVAYLIMNKMMQAEQARRNFEIRKDMLKTMQPVKLRAYERMALLLERISPESLLNRQNIKDLSALNLQAALLRQIREEWEHNLSQQLYIQQDTWVMLKNAKESMIQLINTCAVQMKMNSTALDYAKHILEVYKTVEKTPVDTALAMLKSDVNRLG